MKAKAPLEIAPALLLPVLLAGYLWVAAPQMRVPLFWDEVNFYWNGQAVAETGVPYANAGFLGDRGAIGGQYQYGLWHPPLYLYTLGLAFWLFGASETTARGTGVVLMALTALAVYFLARLVIPRPARDWGALLAVGILLVSPLTIQSALVLDIDGTVLTLLLTAWALLYLRWEDAPRRRQPLVVVALALAFAVTLWAKLTTPFFLLAVVLVYQIGRGRPLRGLAHLLGIGVIGAVLFLLTWDFACTWTGMPFDMPFGVTWAELHDAVGSEGDLSERFDTQALPILAWVSPYLAALFVAATVARVATFARRRRLEPVDFVLGMGILVCAVYFVKLAAGFPKYHVAMLPFWAVVCAHWLSVGWARLPRPAAALALLLSAAACGLALGYALVYVGDNWMLSPRSLETPEALGLVVALAALLLPLALLRPTGPGAVAASLALVLYAGWAMSADWYHSRATYSTNYWYGTRGQQEMAAVVDDLMARTGLSGPYIGAKEVVFYTRHHFFMDQDTVYELWADQARPFDGRLFGYDVPLVAAWVRDPWVRHVFTERLARDYEPVAQAGDYLVFMRRSLAAVAFAPADTPVASAADSASSPEQLDDGATAAEAGDDLAAAAAPAARTDAATDVGDGEPPTPAVRAAEGDAVAAGATSAVPLGAFREPGAGEAP
ncbi:MAG TPA: glycosyltransferase family 39 protein [Chloroflexota bacterium]|nr:glycosyltransferase family 39 protein [Chloroflexota bacterium]